jgi:nickel transport protein
MTRLLLLMALIGGAGALSATAASAHGIQSTLEYLPSSASVAGAESMELQSSFSTGVPARDATVRLLPPEGGQPIELGRTGEDGRITFKLPPTARAGWEIQVDAGPGHRDYLGPEDASSPPTGTGSTPHATRPFPHRIWPGEFNGALTGIAVAGGVGLVAGLRRRS